MPFSSSTKALNRFPGIAAKVAVCLSKPRVPPHRNLGTYWHGATNVQNARKLVRAKFHRVFLTLQPWLLVSLCLVCPPESAHSRGGGFLILRLLRANLASKTKYSVLYTLWHNHSTQNPLIASDWLANCPLNATFMPI